MLADSEAFSGFAVKDTDEAARFYGDVLGLSVSKDDPLPGLLRLHIAGGRDVLVYVKPDHVPATYTILNFPVGDIDAAVDGLTAKGVIFERYDGMDADAKGVVRDSGGPAIAWFTDPSGNILSVLEQS
jgi:catechol 2,3-dioxygenase-like lactoylglutathione lyase family enzyme